MEAQFKVYCFVLVPLDVMLVCSLVGEGGISVSVWDRCQPSIISNLGSYWFVAEIWVEEASHGWGLDFLTKSSPNWLHDLSPLSGDKWT